MSALDQIIDLFTMFQADIAEQLAILVAVLLALATGLLSQIQFFF